MTFFYLVTKGFKAAFPRSVLWGTIPLTVSQKILGARKWNGPLEGLTLHLKDEKMTLFLREITLLKVLMLQKLSKCEVKETCHSDFM